MKKGKRIEYNTRTTQYRLLISTSLYYNYFPKDSRSCSFTGFWEEYRSYRALEQFDCAKNINIFLEIILSIETTKRF